MEKGYKLLLIEDEVKLSNIIKEELTRKGYEIDCAYSSKMAEDLFYKNNYALILLDLNLPDKSGLILCKQFRNVDKKTPIIVLTALGEINDKLVAFNLGADDYLVKPFYFDELFARIKVFISRSENQIGGGGVITVQDLTVDFNNKSVSRAGVEINLTSKEFSMLSLLCKNKGNVVSKQELLSNIWEINFETTTNTVEVYISFIRNKIDKPFAQKLIYTKQGFGYYIKE